MRALTLTLAITLGLFVVGCESGQIAAPQATGVVWTRITSSTDVREPYFPDWRGDQILFSYALPTGQRRLAIVHSDGTGLVLLSATSTERDSPGRWLTDTTLIYASNNSGNFDLWTRGMSDASITRLTSFPESEFDPAPRPGAPGVAYTESDEFRGRIVLIPDTAAVALERIYLTQASLLSGQPEWDPTGQRLCFTADSTGGFRHVWLVNLAAGDSTPVQLTTGPYVDSTPRFSPDGSRILFASNRRTNRPGVWTVSPAGEGAGLSLVAFDDANAVVDTPCWSPDATRIVVSSNGRGFGRSLWVLSNLP
jgi:hypothetical protein